MYRHHRGFTLIEIMLVVVIITTITGLTHFSLGGFSNYKLKTSLNDVRHYLATLRSEAELNNKVIGVFIEEEKRHIHHKVYDLKHQQWTVSPLAYSLHLNNETRIKFTPLETQTSSAIDSVENPDILFLPGGDSSPFELRIQLFSEPNSAFIISSDGHNKIQITKPNETN